LFSSHYLKEQNGLCPKIFWAYSINIILVGNSNKFVSLPNVIFKIQINKTVQIRRFIIISFKGMTLKVLRAIELKVPDFTT